MPTRLKEDFEIPDKLKNIYQEMEISPLGILKNYALSFVNGKIQKYDAEKSYFEKKHGQSLEELRRKIDAMENEENFEWEDDLNDWEFAVENLKYWKRKAVELQGK
ncbi:MAG: hypothetical protein HS132_19250 [Planctomycetia bacterium]|nr:hypothetical protein [Planctomycetia bacterium]